MSVSDARARLAAAQAELVEALVGTGEAPPGFAPEQLRRAARSLAGKRAQEVGRAWPALARCLGENFRARFAAFAARAPLPAEGGPLADGRAFAATLAPTEWTDEARLEVFGVDLRRRCRAAGLVPRRGLALKFAWLREARRLAVGVRVPGLGVYAVGVPLGR